MDLKVERDRRSSDVSKNWGFLEQRLATLEQKLAALEPRLDDDYDEVGISESAVDLSSPLQHNESFDEDGLPIDSLTDGVSPSLSRSVLEFDETVTSEPWSRAKVVVSRYDPTTETRRDFDSEAPSRDTPKQTAYAFLLRKKLSSNEDNVSELTIYGHELIQLLGDSLRHTPNHKWVGPSVTMSSPYEALIQNWDALWRKATSDGTDSWDRRARSDLKLLMETLQIGTGDTKLDQYMSARDTLLKQRSTTFNALWTIFPPGTIVYGKLFLQRDQIFIVRDNFWPWPREEQRGRLGVIKVWKLDCWTYDWNGHYFQRCPLTLEFEQFEGIKPIISLPFYPISYLKKRPEVEQQLVERGKLFRKYCTAGLDERLYKYQGEAILLSGGLHGSGAPEAFIHRAGFVEDNRSSSDEGLTVLDPHKHPMIHSDVMVDFESYYKYGAGTSQIGDTPLRDDDGACRCPHCQRNTALKARYKTEYDHKRGKEDEKWEPLQFMLCPPRVLGYVLRDKQWAQLDVKSLREIPEETNSAAVLDKLVLAGDEGGEETKKLLIGLVKTHGEGTMSKTGRGNRVTDIVAEKGKGLVVLLYGPPGVGKTSTAQVVAVAARRPLLSVGVADMGTSAQHVEANLSRIFDIATTWRAILLIDEADVFLQSRSRGSSGPTTERNALVSVFLKVLEYFQGIMFLTTNQIAQFDVAVQSRIHVAISYQELDRQQTVAIFDQFLNQYIHRQGVESPETIRRYVRTEMWKKNFDGRQIRNIVTSAMGLAQSEDDGGQLTLDHVKHVVGIVEAFKKDLGYQMMQYKERQKGGGGFYND